jgi:hypothetical protein
MYTTFRKSMHDIWKNIVLLFCGVMCNNKIILTALKQYIMYL